jgi:4-nitrophenyl phosphatase
MEQELKSEGIKYCGGTDPEENKFFPSMDFVSMLLCLRHKRLTDCLDDQSDVTADPDVGAVMCGFDSKTNYHKLAKAHRFLRENEGCHFILTNDDSTFPAADGLLYPGEINLICVPKR